MSASWVGQFPLSTAPEAQCVTLLHKYKHLFPNERTLPNAWCVVPIGFSRKEFHSVENLWHQSKSPQPGSGWKGFIPEEKQLAVHTLFMQLLNTLRPSAVRWGWGDFKCEEFTRYPFQLSSKALTPCFSALAPYSQIRRLRICSLERLIGKYGGTQRFLTTGQVGDILSHGF